MEKFKILFKDKNGLHARPAGKLVSLVSGCSSVVTVKNGNKSASAKGLFALMGLGIKCGDEVTIEIEGKDSKSVKESIQNFFEKEFDD